MFNWYVFDMWVVLKSEETNCTEKIYLFIYSDAVPVRVYPIYAQIYMTMQKLYYLQLFTNKSIL